MNGPPEGRRSAEIADALDGTDSDRVGWGYHAGPLSALSRSGNMQSGRTRKSLTQFLVGAKRHTYAAQGDAATVPPPFPGAKQLEFSEGDRSYRDIYFGVRRFAGLEVVTRNGTPEWSMSYAGGMLPPGGRKRAETASVYRFLRKSLLTVSVDAPFRGPRRLVEHNLSYRNRWTGSIGGFSGLEEISQGEQTVYRLRYAGGRVA